MSNGGGRMRERQHILGIMRRSRSGDARIVGKASDAMRDARRCGRGAIPFPDGGGGFMDMGFPLLPEKQKGIFL